jgi:hypothetical protein
VKRSDTRNKELSFEIEQTDEMTKDDLDDLIHILTAIIKRRQQTAESSADDTER